MIYMFNNCELSGNIKNENSDVEKEYIRMVEYKIKYNLGKMLSKICIVKNSNSSSKDAQLKSILYQVVS